MIFDERVHFKPFEYPICEEFASKIRESYWTHDEWTFTEDINQYHAQLDSAEQDAIRKSMLAISQVEVSVKSFWGDLYKRLPKPEINLAGTGFAESECFSDDTEVLTLKGWRLFKNIEKDDLVAQYDIKTQNIDFDKPISYIEKKYIGKLHHYKNRCTDLMVTPNHEILLINPHNKKLKKGKSNSGIWGRNFYYPCSGLFHQGLKKFEPIDALLIAIQADGSLFGNCPTGTGRKDFAFSLKKYKKIERLRYLCKKAKIDIYERKRKNGFTIISGKLPDHIDVTKIKNFDYINLKDINQEYCDHFFHELQYWDATKIDNRLSYYNTNIEALDKIQAMCSLSGRDCIKSINRTKEESQKRLLPDGSKKKTSKDMYILSINTRSKKIYPHRQEIDYDGKVYCLEMPKGTLIVRRNGRVAISGNCRHAMAYAQLLEYLGLNEEFEKIYEIPCIIGRMNYLKKYKTYLSDKDHRKFLKSLILFSLFVENVSLFGQFFIIASFYKHKNLLKDMTAVVTSTSKEELLHAEFGIWAINQIKKEVPDLWDWNLKQSITNFAQKAYDAECKVIDWILAKPSFIKKGVVKDFLRYRFNESLEKIGIDPIFEVKKSKEYQWYVEEIYTSVHGDFFSSRPSSYSLHNKPVNAEDLF